MWEFLQEELSSVQREIEEWRDTMDTWHQHCQVQCSCLVLFNVFSMFFGQLILFVVVTVYGLMV